MTSDASGKHTLQPRGARTDSVYDERVNKVARGAQTKPNQDNALAFSKLEARFASDARVTPRLDAVVTRCLSRAKEDRFASASEVERALQGPNVVPSTPNAPDPS